MIIRSAAPPDAEALARVHGETWRTAYRGIVPDAHLDRLASSYDKRVARWREGLTNPIPGTFVLVAEQEGRVVAFATGGAERDGHPVYKGELWAVYVLAEFQRRGIGRRLTHAVATELQRRGFASMLVWVLRDNPSRAFYERLGGMPAGEKEIEIGGKKLVEVAYGWEDIGRLIGNTARGNHAR